MTNHFPRTGILISLATLGFWVMPDSTSANALINLNTLSVANTAIDVGGNIEANVASTTEAKVDANVDLDAGASGVDMMTSPDMPEGESLNVKRRTVEGKVDVDSDEAIAVDAKSVSTNADLNTYAEVLVRENSAVEEINFTGETVELRHRQEGRLLALFPITFTVTAVAFADGRVELRYPWYSAFTVDNKEELNTKAKVAVDNALRARTVGSVRAEGQVASPRFTAGESAIVARELASVLSSNFEMNSDTK